MNAQIANKETTRKNMYSLGLQVEVYKLYITSQTVLVIVGVKLSTFQIVFS